MNSPLVRNFTTHFFFFKQGGQQPLKPQKTLKNPWNGWYPWKGPWDTLKIGMVPEKIWKKARENWRLVRNDCSGGYIFKFGSWIFACGGQLSLYVASLTYFFHFPVYFHPGKQSLSKGFKGTWQTIKWHRNCPGGCQYQLLNCSYTSIGQWICVIIEWLSIGNIHIVVSAINGLQSVVWLVVIYLLCHPASCRLWRSSIVCTQN